MKSFIGQALLVAATGASAALSGQQANEGSQPISANHDEVFSKRVSRFIGSPSLDEKREASTCGVITQPSRTLTLNSPTTVTMPSTWSCFAVVGGYNTYTDMWHMTVTPGSVLHLDFVTSGYQGFLGLIDPVTGLDVATSPCQFGQSASCSFDYTASASEYFLAFGGVTPTGNYTIEVTSSASTGLPNLTPYRPDGWSDKIVVSKVPCVDPCDTNVDSPSLLSTDSLYVSVAYLNNGTASRPAVTRTVRLYIDGADSGWWWGPGVVLQPNYYGWGKPINIGSLTAGPHTLTMKVDADHEVTESNENDNDYTKTIMVGSSSGLPCRSSATTLCFGASNRFSVRVHWVASDGRTGDGQAINMTGDTGYFWFFNSANVELVIKILDGTGINSHYWVFYGALSDVQYTITVTDTFVGVTKTYENPQHNLASVADTTAF
jgi:hypothetical protein